MAQSMLFGGDDGTGKREAELRRKATPTVFDGKTIDPLKDNPRLQTALDRTFDLMRDGKQRTLKEIASAVGCSEAGASARLRDLRKHKNKQRYPVQSVNSERVAGGFWVYWVEAKKELQ